MANSAPRAEFALLFGGKNIDTKGKSMYNKNN